MKKHIKIYEFADEYGALHSLDCCTNYPEDSRACDADMKPLDCCQNMKMVKAIIDEAIERTVKFMSHDMEWEDEEQRKCAVKMYLE